MSDSKGRQRPIENEGCHESFYNSKRPHILQITNHGIHDWNVIPGLPDTGGQNVFVNQMTEALADLGFKVTIANRGGFAHPKTGKLRKGLDYLDEHRRILYLEDSVREFVRKEDMKDRVPELADFLLRFLAGEKHLPSMLISHYWDAAAVAVDLNRKIDDMREHFWVPHSLGAVKKRNMDRSTWKDLRIDERIEEEARLLEDVNGVAATSKVIRDSLHNDYGCATDIYLPPCVNPKRFHPREIEPDDEIWDFLSNESGLSKNELHKAKIITEVSRTDKTKRKDVLIEAFAAVVKEVPEALLLLTVDKDAEPLAGELRALAEEKGVAGRIVMLGSVWDALPKLYAITHVYCTPSVMEGFGMSIQEAAATGVPAVASDLVPFAVEYLLGDEVTVVEGDEQNPVIREGEGAIVVAADATNEFARGILRLLKDEELRRKMGEQACRITVPYFTWSNMTEKFLEAAGLTSSGR